MKFPEVSLTVEHIQEPQLEFCYGQPSAHPKDGLYLYGPWSKAKKTREVRIGIVGTPDGLAHFRDWARKLKTAVKVPPPGRGKRRTVCISPIFRDWRRRSGSHSSPMNAAHSRYLLPTLTTQPASSICMRQSIGSRHSSSIVSESISETTNAPWMFGSWCCRRLSSRGVGRNRSVRVCRWSSEILARSSRRRPICRSYLKQT